MDNENWIELFEAARNAGTPDLTSESASLDDALDEWGMEDLALEVEDDGTDDVRVLFRDSRTGGLVVAYIDPNGGGPSDGTWCAYRIATVAS